MFSEFTIDKLSDIICGNVEYMPYLSGPMLIDLFNLYGFRDIYERGFPSRATYARDKLTSLNDNGCIVKFMEEIVHPRRFIDFEFTADNAVMKINELIIYDGYKLEKINGIFKLYPIENVGIQPETIVKLEYDYVTEQILKCDKKIMEKDYDGAITNSRTLIESIMLQIANELDKSYNHDGDLNKLYKEIKGILNLEIKRGEYPESIIQLLSGLTTIVNGISSIRNSMSDAHPRRYKPGKHHAKLAVNCAKTISEFLVDSMKYQKEILNRNI